MTKRSLLNSYLFVLCCFFSCQDEQSDKKIDDFQDWSSNDLAEHFCSRCHDFTPPSLLPKASWRKVLPNMGRRLGINTNVDPYNGKMLEETFYIQQAKVFSERPELSDTLWQKLVSYYLNNAPDTLVQIEAPCMHDSEIFRPAIIPFKMGGFPVVTLVEFDKTDQKFYVGDLNGQLVRLDQTFDLDMITQTYSPVVDITRTPTGNLIMTQIGFLDKNDQRAGSIESTDISTLSSRSPILKELVRPVQTEMADLNSDGQIDLVVASFGNHTGDLAWYDYQSNGYHKHLISGTTGPIKMQILDWDLDNDSDILTLFAQGDERVSIFVNTGSAFEEKVLLRFNPLRGSCDFQFVDIDGDGDKDLVIAQGDNSDYTITLKPYHGIRIFTNTQDRFIEERFIPMHGVTKVHAEDFDQDGDMDMVTHAFYSDFTDSSHQAIIYWEHHGNLQFESWKIPLSSKGRWLVSDIGDIDRDDDIDIVLGSFVLGPGIVPEKTGSDWQQNVDHLLFLENLVK